MLRKSSVFAALLALIFCPLPHPAVAGDGYADYVATRTVRQQEEISNTRWLDVPGRGATLYYAQNNPFWNDMRYEKAGSSSYRRFGDGGCCPTSAAIAIANLLPLEELGKIHRYSYQSVPGYGLSTGSMNPLNMRSSQGVFWLNTAADYQKYLPLVFGQYAAGNNQKGNIWRAQPKESGVSSGGTGVGFVRELCAIYGLNYIKVEKDSMDWVEPIRNGATAVALANTTAQPFVKAQGHYVAIVGCDEEYLYIMDPQDKTDYQNDRKAVLEVVESGLVRVRIKDYKKLYIGVVYVLTNAQVEAKLAGQSAAVPGNH